MMLQNLVFSLLVSYVVCQNLPTIILTGEPRVVARRIINADLHTARQMALPDDNEHIRYRVNVVNQRDPAQESYQAQPRTQVEVYRRILRPARITFTGDSVVTDNWQGTGDAVELESWTLNRRPTMEGTFVQTQPAH